MLFFNKGVSLDKKGASVTWDSKHVDENAYYADRLHIRQILLGHTAKAGEYNVVEVSKRIKKTITNLNK